MTAPKERPILFTGRLVREIMAGRKTETRRLVKRPRVTRADGWPLTFSGWPCDGTGTAQHECEKPAAGHVHAHLQGPTHQHWQNLRSPYGVGGGTLWVRETWAPIPMDHPDPGTYALGNGCFHRADYLGEDVEHVGIPRWKPSIHMPRTMCRLRLKVTSVHIEPLHDITAEGVQAEGVALTVDKDRHPLIQLTGNPYLDDHPILPGSKPWTIEDYWRAQFACLWESINGKREGASWDANPWVWVVKFERIT